MAARASGPVQHIVSRGQPTLGRARRAAKSRAHVCPQARVAGLSSSRRARVELVCMSQSMVSGDSVTEWLR